VPVSRRFVPTPAFLVEAIYAGVLDRRQPVGCFCQDTGKGVRSRRKHVCAADHQRAARNLESDDGPWIEVDVVGSQVRASLATAGPETHDQPTSAGRLSRNVAKRFI